MRNVEFPTVPQTLQHQHTTARTTTTAWLNTTAAASGSSASSSAVGPTADIPEWRAGTERAVFQYVDNENCAGEGRLREPSRLEDEPESEEDIEGSRNAVPRRDKWGRDPSWWTAEVLSELWAPTVSTACGCLPPAIVSSTLAAPSPSRGPDKNHFNEHRHFNPPFGLRAPFCLR